MRLKSQHVFDIIQIFSRIFLKLLSISKMVQLIFFLIFIFSKFPRNFVKTSHLSIHSTSNEHRYQNEISIIKKGTKWRTNMPAHRALVRE